MRRYDEPIEVRVAERADVAPDVPVGPDCFLWRGRLFVVREVQDHWAERRAWWRDDPEPDTRGAPAAAGTADRGYRAVTSRQVWRVEARAGASGPAGVFDLGSDGAHGPWRLLRSHD